MAIAGGSVIAFTMWSLAKICLFLAFADVDALQQLLGLDSASLATTTAAALAAIALVDLAIRVYVGRSARAEGNGEAKSLFYLGVAAFAAAANASSLVAIALSTSFATSPLSMIPPIAIEATSIAALVLVISSSIRLRRMAKAAG